MELVCLLLGIAAITAEETPLTMTVSERSKTAYDYIKKEIYRYAIFAVKDALIIDQETTGRHRFTYDHFKEDLTKKAECRYGLIDYEYTDDCRKDTPWGVAERTLALFSWSPDSAKMEDKMVCKNGLSLLKDTFPEVDNVFEATNLTEVSESHIQKKLMPCKQR